MNKDKQQFYKEFYSALEKAMEPSGGRLIEMDIPKNNRTMKGITVKFDNVSAAPTIYPDFYYPDWKDGRSMSNIVSGIRSELLKTVNKISHFSIESMKPESADTHLYASVVNYENNKEWLQTVPHERVADLAVFAKWRLGSVDNNSVVTAKVTEPLLAHLKLTKEEMLKMAKTNTAGEATYRTMGEIMNDVYDFDGTDQDMRDAIMEHPPAPFHVLSNESGIDGAALIACPEVLKAVHKEIGEDFYILPSSIQEVLILPKSVTDDVEGLNQMVSSINEQEVEPEEQLSNHIYEFDGHSLKLAGATELKQDHGLTESVTYHRGR